MVAEYVNGSKAKTYTLGDRRISQTVGGETHYYGTDQQGSVKFLTNTSGLTDDYTYDSFGVLKNQSGTTDNDFRYTGEQFDDTLNMYNLRARYYAPEIGRFYGLDTYQGRMSDPESLHKYLYTSNDPINMIDPSGHMSLTQANIGLAITGILASTALNSISLNSSSHPSNIKTELFLLGYPTQSSVSLNESIIDKSRKKEEREVERKAKIKANELAVEMTLLSSVRQILFHYTTSKVAANEMLAMQCIFASRFYGGHIDGIPRPQGAYATPLQPWMGGITQTLLKEFIYNKPKGRVVTHYVAVLNIGDWQYLNATEYVKQGIGCVPAFIIHSGINLMPL